MLFGHSGFPEGPIYPNNNTFNIFSHFPLLVFSHADSFVFMCSENFAYLAARFLPRPQKWDYVCGAHSVDE